MFNKIKIHSLILNKFANNLAMVLMSLATVLGMFELSQKSYQKVVLNDSNNAIIKPANDPNNPIRREKEEADSNYVSYTESQRTYPRSGKY